jgi:hypothetical protein
MKRNGERAGLESVSIFDKLVCFAALAADGDKYAFID